MEFIVLIYDAEGLAKVFTDPLENNMVRVDDVTEEEAGRLAEILTAHNVGVCLIPHKEQAQ